MWIFFLVFPVVLLAGSDFQLAYQYYKKGNYEKSLAISERYLKKHKSGDIHSDKLLYIYVTSETSLYRIDQALDNFVKNNKNSKMLSLSIYRTMERALVLGSYDTGAKWGEIFKRQAQKEVFYGKGLFLYSCILHSAKQNNKLKELIHYSLALPIDSFSRKRILKIKNNHKF